MASTRVVASRTPVARAPAVAAGGWLAQGYEQALGWLERAHQRRHLAMLSDHMLKDIGLTRADVEAEISKPFWRE